MTTLDALFQRAEVLDVLDASLTLLAPDGLHPHADADGLFHPLHVLQLHLSQQVVEGGVGTVQLDQDQAVGAGRAGR